MAMRVFCALNYPKTPASPAGRYCRLTRHLNVNLTLVLLCQIEVIDIQSHSLLWISFYSHSAPQWYAPRYPGLSLDRAAINKGIRVLACRGTGQGKGVPKHLLGILDIPVE